MVFKLIIHGDVDGAILKKDWRLHLMNNKSNIDSATLRMTTKSYNFIILLTKDLKVSLRMTMQSNCLIKKIIILIWIFILFPWRDLSEFEESTLTASHDQHFKQRIFALLLSTFSGIMNQLPQV